MGSFICIMSSAIDIVCDTPNYYFFATAGNLDNAYQTASKSQAKQRCKDQGGILPKHITSSCMSKINSYFTTMGSTGSLGNLFLDDTTVQQISSPVLCQREYHNSQGLSSNGLHRNSPGVLVIIEMLLAFESWFQN